MKVPLRKVNRYVTNGDGLVTWEWITVGYTETQWALRIQYVYTARFYQDTWRIEKHVYDHSQQDMLVYEWKEPTTPYFTEVELVVAMREINSLLDWHPAAPEYHPPTSVEEQFDD